MRKRLLLAGALVFVVTGCRAEGNIVLTVQEDGSGAVSVEIGFDDELIATLEEGGNTMEGQLDIDQSPDRDDWVVRVEGDMTFYTLPRPFSDPGQLEDVVDAELAQTTSRFTDLRLVVGDDGGVTLNATLSTPDIDEAGEIDRAIIEMGDISSSFYADLPGTLEDSNADEVLSNGRLMWEIPLEGGEVTIQAVTNGGRGGLPNGAIIAIGAAVLLLAGTFVWWSRRHRSAQHAVVATAVGRSADGASPPGSG